MTIAPGIILPCNRRAMNSRFGCLATRDENAGWLFSRQSTITQIPVNIESEIMESPANFNTHAKSTFK